MIGMAKLESLTRLPLRHVAMGVAIRELLAPWTGHPYDFEIWVRLGFYTRNLVNPYGRLAYIQGLSSSPFATTGSISYPPFSAFIFALTYRLYALLGEPSRFLYYFLLKQLMVWADVGAAIVLGKIILLSGDRRSARTALLVWLYFPLGIIISSMWGQLDSISLFLSLLAIYFFLVSKWLPSAAMLGLAIYLKTLPIVFLPVFLMQSQARNIRLAYSLVSLVIPVAGTLVPALAFNWGYYAMYNNLSFQVAIPLEGAMSVLGLAYYTLPLASLALYVTGSIWIPVLLATYVYVWKKGLPLFHGLLIVILAFSISRPFLPEQWTLYPLALLLLVQTRENMGHFLGLALASTVFLAFNNGLLVRFFTPVWVGAFNWDVFVDPSPYVAVWVVIRSVLALLYFTESLLVIRGRESIIYRAILSVRSDWSLQRRHIFSNEVGPA
jgi:Mannosyltransferase (PIG-M)